MMRADQRTVYSWRVASGSRHSKRLGEEADKRRERMEER